VAICTKSGKGELGISLWCFHFRFLFSFFSLAVALLAPMERPSRSAALKLAAWFHVVPDFFPVVSLSLSTALVARQFVEMSRIRIEVRVPWGGHCLGPTTSQRSTDFRLGLGAGVACCRPRLQPPACLAALHSLLLPSYATGPCGSIPQVGWHWHQATHVRGDGQLSVGGLRVTWMVAGTPPRLPITL
jgi:hypothetical protein